MSTPVRQIEDIYPLSPMQQGMLYHSLAEPDSAMYVEQTSWTVDGPFHASAFEWAWQRAVDRHPVLRTDFDWEELDEPVQVVHRDVRVPMEQLDWRHLSADRQQRKIEVFLKDERERGFDLAQVPLMRLAVIRMADDAHCFVWSLHHILMDGWSTPLLLKEVFALYDAFCRGDDLQLKQPRPYRDYIAWLRQQDRAAAKRYWQTALRGLVAPTKLPFDGTFRQSSATSQRYAKQAIQLPVEATEELRKFARRNQLTMNTLLQGAFAILLSRYGRERDVLFGATVSGRPVELDGVEDMLGLFINTLPVRVAVDENEPVVPWLRRLQQLQAQRSQFESSSLVDIQRWSDLPQGRPMFDTILVVENFPRDALAFGGQAAGRLRDFRSFERANYPLSVVAGDVGRFLLRATFDRCCWQDASVERMLHHLRILLRGIAADPAQVISQLSMMDGRERHQVLVEWNQTVREYPHEATVGELFEAQVERAPGAVAVVSEGEQLTYGQLNVRANRLAHTLRRLGVGPDVPVAISVEPCIEMVVGTLAILKAGGAYVPLDPDYPKPRLALMLEDSNTPVVLTRSHLKDQLPANGRTVLCLDDEQPVTAPSDDSNPNVDLGAENLAYVIYTSGSTGRPKGTAVPHRAIVHLVSNTDYVQLGPGDAVAQVSSCSFDAATFEIWGALLNGARLVLVPHETVLSPARFAAQLENDGVTTLFLTTALFHQMAREMPRAFKSLRHVLFGGEQVDPRWVREVLVHGPPERLLHVYGPTETTTFASWYQVREVDEDARTVPIGRGIANTQLYVLDENRNPVPVGVPGELYIGGAGVARGYWNDQELTAEKFVDCALSGDAVTRLYRTGDQVRWLAGGTIEFLGRVDHQIKLRGFRVELGEIETELRKHPLVSDAVVTVRQDQPEDKQLVAYVQVEGERVAASDVRAHVRRTLPSYMVPAHVVVLDALPLSPNGKVDRQALPPPVNPPRENDNGYVAPRNEVERQLATLWEDLLRVDQVGIEDDFFELGGNSLLAITLFARIEKTLGVKPPISVLFQGPTIRRLAAKLDDETAGTTESLLVPVQTRGAKPPLFAAPPGGVDDHYYRDLAARLGEDQPFYALPSSALASDALTGQRVEDIAAHWVKQIRAIQPHGPYHLAGTDIGAIVAFEMAQQLTGQGERVGLLALLDTPAGDHGENRSSDFPWRRSVKLFLGRLYLEWGDLRRLPLPRKLAYLGRAWRQWLRRGKRLLLKGANRTKGMAGAILGRSGRMAAPSSSPAVLLVRNYRARAYREKITLLKASWQPGGSDADPTLGWGELAGGGLQVHVIPGHHESIAREPRVEMLADRLRMCLDNARQESSPVPEMPYPATPAGG